MNRFSNAGSKGRIMEEKMVAGRVMLISRALKGLEAWAGRILRRTATNPTPMRRNSPTRLESKAEISVCVTSLIQCKLSVQGNSRRQNLSAAAAKISGF